MLQREGQIISKKKIETPVRAEVLFHNYGKKPSEETKSNIMEFIESHKAETIALTFSVVSPV